MPQVPLMVIPQQSQSGLPGAMEDSRPAIRNIPEGGDQMQALGASITRAGAGLQDAINTNRNIQAEAQFNAGYQASHDAVTNILTNPDNGFLTTKKGQDAVDLQPFVAQSLQGIASTVPDSITDPVAQRKYKEAMAQTVSLALEKVNIHTAAENKTARLNSQQAVFDAARDQAAQVFDPKFAANPNRSDDMGTGNALYQHNLDIAQSTAEAMLRDQGVPEAAIAQKVKELMAPVYIGTFNHLMDAQQTNYAQTYVQQLKADGSVPTAITDQMTAQLKGPSDAQQATATAIKLAKQFPGNPTRQIQAANELFESDGISAQGHGMIVQQIHAAESMRVEQLGQTRNSLLGQAWSYVQSHPGATVATMPNNFLSFASSDGAFAKELDSIVNYKPNMVDDTVLRDSLMTMAGKDPVAFADMDLIPYKSKVTPQTFNMLEELKLRINSSDAKAMTSGRNIETTLNQFSPDVHTALGITGKPIEGSDDSVALANFKNQFRATVQSMEKDTGHVLPPEEVSKVLRGMIKDEVLQKRDWLPNKTARGFQIPADQMTPELQSDLGSWSIPSDERKTAIAAIKQAGKPVTEDNILTVYKNTHGIK